jgi:protein-tyrosine phosphatase
MTQEDLRLTVLPNIRDLGGLVVEGDRRVQRGLLYRSEAPSALPAQTLATLAHAGIRLVCDLRSDDERARVPHSWPGEGPVEVLVRAGDRAVAGEIDHRHAIARLDDGTGDAAREFMLEGYRALPARLAPILRSFVDRILAGTVPALLHCAAGKDRTGFGCAVLLTALGASNADIEDEYLRSNQAIDAARFRAIVEANTTHRIGLPTANAMLCRREYLRAAMTEAETANGSLDAYLEQELGLTPARRSELRHLLLEEHA